MSARSKARAGDFPLGDKSKEMLLQEIFSLENTKEAFRKPDWQWKYDNAVGELNARFGIKRWGPEWDKIFRPKKGKSAPSIEEVLERHNKKK